MYHFTIKGSRHHKNEDALVEMQNSECAVAALADGISQATHAGLGAEVSALSLGTFFLHCGKELSKMQPDFAAVKTVETVRKSVESAAQRAALPAQELAAAITGVWWAPESLITCNLGTSVVIGCSQAEPGCQILEQPVASSAGCPSVSTEAAERMLSLHRWSAQMDHVFLLSDGAWRHLLHHGWIRQEICEILQNARPERLAHFLEACHPQDDCSFIMMSRPQGS